MVWIQNEEARDYQCPGIKTSVTDRMYSEI